MTAFQEKIAKFADVKCFCYEENRFSHRRWNVGGEWIQDVPWQRRPLGERARGESEAWYADPDFVTAFYNGLRKKLYGAQPNEGHRLIAGLEQDYDVTVVTQNVDNLHEKAGSHKVIHLHGELTKVCSTIDPYDPKYIRELSEQDCEVAKGAKAGDGSLLRPFIVFFGEAVPMIEPAAEAVKEADIFVVVGTSLNVCPAAGLIAYTRKNVPVYLIDPADVMGSGYRNVTHIKAGASEGMRQLVAILKDSPFGDKQ